MKQSFKIAQFGAFDVNSYGDSLFPTVLKKELEERIAIDSITLFAPTAKQKGYNGNTVYAYHDFVDMHKKMHFDCLIIGGGELFHFNPISFKNSMGEEVYEGGYLWRKPLEWANEYNLPVIMNGVGVPYSFSKEQKEEISKLLEKVVYFSVRDEYSYERVKDIVPENILETVPDSVWKMKQVFEADELEKTRKELGARYHCDLTLPYIVVQYGTTYKLSEMIEQVRMIRENHNVQVIVLSINYSHEDLDAVFRWKEKSDDNTIYITDLLQPVEIVSLISSASVFIGTSLHGNLTAMRYGVPAIAIDMYPSFVSKMDGLFGMLDLSDYLFVDLSDLAGIFDTLIQEAGYKARLNSVLAVIDEKCKSHFDRITMACRNGLGEYMGKESKDMVESDIEYKKVYIRYVDKNGNSVFKKCIAKSCDNHYVFVLDISSLKEDSVELSMMVDCPTVVKVENCMIDGKKTDFRIDSTSLHSSDVYMEREIKINICNIAEGHIELLCLLEERACSDVEKAYFSAVNNKDMHIDQLIQSERNYLNQIDAVTKKKDIIIQKKDSKINNQRAHIEQLLDIERQYQNIVHSKGWRLVSFPGRVFERLYPVGTKRRTRVSTVAKYIHALNWTNIKFVSGAFCKGGVKQVKREMNAFKLRTSDEIPQIKPHIYAMEEITDINECDKLVFKKHEHPVISIVIPVYNQFTYTYYCLKSILENSGDVSYEIIIADDVSNDLTTRLSEVAENINIVRNKENQRFLRNCNHAAQYAKGDYILFLNNDTQVQSNWLQPLLDLIESDASVGMVGSKLIYPDGSLQEAGGIIWGDGHAWNYGNGQNANQPQFNYVKEVDYISGAAIMIRTSLWKEIGGFDEHFAPAYCEDSDLAFEVRKHGYKLMYQPLSVVVHFEGKSNGTDTSTGVKRYQIENSKKLAEKWKEEFKYQSQTEDDLFRARERSQKKKVILVIDHYVPQFDKDAGSKTTWQYLKMFVKKGYSVKFIGDNFYQDEPYTTALQQIGVEVLYGPWYAQNYKQWILDNQKDIDFVYLNRPHITEKYIDFLKEETDIKCIYYGHDLHFLRVRREYELNGNQALLEESEVWKKKEFDIMRKADINYYPSYVEVDEIHKIDAEIPAKAITAYVYEQFREDISLDFAKRNGILFVGGFSHPPNEDAVLWFASEVYPIIKKQQDIPFYIVGSNATDKVKKLNSNGIVLKGFVTEEELEELYNTCKLVVVPLRYGAGVKGKVVEALYYGVPMVTTTVGIEGIKDAEAFMEVADDAETFASKVLALYNDNEKLAETVWSYQDYVKENNSIDAVWNIVKEDFQ